MQKTYIQEEHISFCLCLSKAVCYLGVELMSWTQLMKYEVQKSHYWGWCGKEATPKLRCSSSSVFLSTAGIGCQDPNRDLEMEKDLEREDMTLAGQSLGEREKWRRRHQTVRAGRDDFLESLIIGKSQGLNFSKNRELSHNHGWMHHIDCLHLERFAHLARMKTINREDMAACLWPHF